MLFLICLLPRAMDYDDVRAGLHLDTGMALLGQGLLERAEEEFRKVLDIGDQYSAAFLGLGMVYLRRSSWSTAADYLREYIEECPDDHRGYLELSRLHLLTGRTDSASFMAESAFARAPGDPSIWLHAGRASLELGDMASAEQWFRKGMENRGSTTLESLVLLSSVYRRTERGHEARELLLPAVEAGYAPACWELARVYLSWGDYLRAHDCISMYLSMAPSGCFADSAVILLEELGRSGEYMD